MNPRLRTALFSSPGLQAGVHEPRPYRQAVSTAFPAWASATARGGRKRSPLKRAKILLVLQTQP